ncbi:unnamed protein product [Clonostachys rosea]|uniref:2'-phosphotransferase n=1 Tax=Bionectria ochroleuca TaxID=29856 RepID=A0ABY6TTS4_BIOOC|nr:unnamed protein product [Clonostachys rosea]
MADNDAHHDLEDRAHGRSGGRRGGGGRRGRGGGGGGGGMSREVQISKALSRLLRHQAENAGITLDGEGYAPLDRVLAWGPLRSLQVSFEDIQSAVSNNEKQRFALKPNPATNPELSTESTTPSDYLIRANQGHSIKVESSGLLVPITLAGEDGDEGNPPPEKVVHGTYFAFWAAIVEAGGLKVMGRNHVHCSEGTPEDGVVSGMRRDAELMVEIDLERSIKEGGLRWWRSENGVILTEGDESGLVSSRFFKRVTSRTQDVGVLWEDGEWVSDLPAGLKMRVPHGKGPGGGRGGRGGRGRGGNRNVERS